MGGRTNLSLVRWGAAALATLLAVAGAALAHELDHPVPSFSEPAPLSSTINSGGEGATWEMVASLPTGNPHTDLDFFEQGGDVYASVGTLANGPNAGGQTIVRLTKDGLVEPSYVTGHPSASCLSAATGVTGLQHDVEAAPKGDTILGSANPHADRRDTQIVVDATDASGRCHDQGVLGAAETTPGGLEIIDVTDPSAPKEIGLTSHVGMAHTVNIDPKRPHIAFVSSSDVGDVDEQGKRANEESGNAMDGIEVVDMSSCMNFPAGTTLDAKRKACNPTVYRYRWPQPEMTQATAFRRVGACHELEIYPDDRLACAAVTGTALFDFKGAFDDNGTPTNFLDDKPRGAPLPCFRRETSTVFPAFQTGALVVDCANGGSDGSQSLSVSEWLKLGAPSLEGVRWIGTVPHMGYSANQDHLTAPFDATEDIIVAHEAELTGSGRYVLTTDERGGGVIPGGATCAPGADNTRGNGGIHAFPVSSFTTSPPRDPAQAQQLIAKTSEGARAVFRAPVRTEPQASVCTSHVFHQIPGQNRIFMAWYSQGTQVVDFVENADGTIDFKNAAWFIPEHSNQWVSSIFKVQENADGSFTYWGATGDFLLGDAGRNTIDVYKVTLPAPPKPAGAAATDVKYPSAPIAGVESERARSAPCARTTAFDSIRVAASGRRLGFRIQRRGTERIRFDLFRVSRRRTVMRQQVADRVVARNNFAFTAPLGLRPGYYVARLRTPTPSGQSDVRHIALRLTRKGFTRQPSFQRHRSCQLVEQALLGRPVFGGSNRRPLGVAFELSQRAKVTVEVRRGSKLVKRLTSREYVAERVHRLRFHQRRGARGLYRVVIKAEAPGKSDTITLRARRL